MSAQSSQLITSICIPELAENAIAKLERRMVKGNEE
jgi:hypothetical protein